MKYWVTVDSRRNSQPWMRLQTESGEFVAGESIGPLSPRRWQQFSNPGGVVLKWKKGTEGIKKIPSVPFFQRAGRIIRPAGKLILSMNSNEKLENELLHSLRLLRALGS